MWAVSFEGYVNMIHKPTEWQLTRRMIKVENYQTKITFLERNETSYFEENYIKRAPSCVKKYFQKVADLSNSLHISLLRLLWKKVRWTVGGGNGPWIHRECKLFMWWSYNTWHAEGHDYRASVSHHMVLKCLVKIYHTFHRIIITDARAKMSL